MSRPASRLAILSRIDAPTAARVTPQAMDQTSVRFGPFGVGAQVRVQASVNAWLLFGDAEVDVASGDGVPLAAWDRPQFEVTSPEATYVAIVPDGGPGEGVAVAWEAARAEGCE